MEDEEREGGQEGRDEEMERGREGGWTLQNSTPMGAAGNLWWYPSSRVCPRRHGSVTTPLFIEFECYYLLIIRTVCNT